MSVGLEVALLADGDVAELDALLDACPTSFAQQTRAWRDVIAAQGVDEPLFLGARRDGRLVAVLPGYRFDGPRGAILTSVPQAGPLGGIACRVEDRREVYPPLLAAYTRLAVERGCALASLISNPIWPDHELYREAFAPDYTLENSCLVLDLETALDAEGSVAAASGNLRRNLKRALSDDLRVDEEQSADNVAAWYAIHESRAHEIDATPLPRRLFTAALEHAVPAGKGRFFFVRRRGDDEMLAGGFYVAHGRTLDALMPAMRSDAAKLAPNFRLALHSMYWARAQGLRYYNWQASPPTGGVDRFKRQWGSVDHAYCYFTKVTGDASALLASTPAELAADYPWHYVLPFDQLGGGAATLGGTSTRAAAWEARRSP